MATKPENSVSKEKMFVALATVSVAISSPTEKGVASRQIYPVALLWSTGWFLELLFKLPLLCVK